MSDDLYQQAIIALAKRARDQPRLEGADHTATIDNPLCGDRITIDFVTSGDRVVKVGHKTRGCLLCEASACLITEHAPGEAIDGLKGKAETLITDFSDRDHVLADLWPGLEMLAPAQSYKSRHECVILPFKALLAALQETS